MEYQKCEITFKSIIRSFKGFIFTTLIFSILIFVVSIDVSDDLTAYYFFSFFYFIVGLFPFSVLFFNYLFKSSKLDKVLLTYDYALINGKEYRIRKIELHAKNIYYQGIRAPSILGEFYYYKLSIEGGSSLYISSLSNISEIFDKKSDYIFFKKRIFALIKKT